MFFLPRGRRKRPPASRQHGQEKRSRRAVRPRLEALEGRWAPAVLTVTTAADSGPGSLRQAILDANSSPGADTINFGIGPGARTITPSSPLPAVTDPVTIDGTTEPGWAGVPLVTVDGGGAGACHGLVLLATNCVVRGLTITHFAGSGVLSLAIRNGFQGNLLVDNGLDGLTLGALSAVGNCLLSGNGRDGVFEPDGNGNCFLQGNYIGTDLSGTAARPNGQAGVVIINSFGGGSINGNLISGNGGPGLYLQDVASYGDFVFDGNRIGTNLAGTAAVPNAGPGVGFLGSRMMPPGTSPFAIADSLISGNAGSGVLVQVANGGTSVAVDGCQVGTDVAGTAALPNGGDGVTFLGGSGGGVSNSVVSGNRGSGVFILSSIDTVSGCKIGTNASGTAALPNGVDGVTSANAAPTLTNDLLSGNGRSGVFMGGEAVGNGMFPLVEKCRIGVNAAGDAALGNAFDGVTVANGHGSAENCVISGNGRYGVLVGGQGAGASLAVDFIGTNAAGTAAVGNAQGGVFAYAGAGLTVSGKGFNTDPASPVMPNAISGNGGNGITVVSAGPTGSGNQIGFCRIGTNAAGTAALPNAGDGIALLDGPSGGLLYQNLISGNAGNGISLSGSATTENAIYLQNQIGVALDGSPLGNGGNGVFVTGGAHDNEVGGRSEDFGAVAGGPGNEIAFNGGDGVRIVSGTGNAVLGNSIHDNAGLGIDLGGNGVTPNDSAGHSGPNHYQNFPVITAVAPGANGGTDISFTLDSVPSTAFQVEFFANAAADPSGFGEGQTYLGDVTATTDAGGHVAATAHVAATVAAGQKVTATATNPAVGAPAIPFGDTSEFSAAFPPPAS